MDATAGARSAQFPAGSVRAAVAARDDDWRVDVDSNSIKEHYRDGEAMLTCARLKLSAVTPAKRVEWREFTERNARGERHPTGSDGYPGAVL